MKPITLLHSSAMMKMVMTIHKQWWRSISPYCYCITRDRDGLFDGFWN